MATFRLFLISFLVECCYLPLEYTAASNPTDIAPEQFIEAGKDAPEWDFNKTVRARTEHFRAVFVSPEESERLNGAIYAAFTFSESEPYTIFLITIHNENRLHLCQNVLHEMVHLMLRHQTGSGDIHHKQPQFKQLYKVQERLCGKAEYECQQSEEGCQ